jgi:uncharacterized protein (TIGR02099 family)
MTEKKYPLRLKDLLRLRPTTSSWAQWSRRLLILGLIIVSLGVIGHLLIRFVVWPQIETSKPAIEKLLSERIGVSVKIDHLHVHWEGIRPVFDMTGLEFIPNPNQQTAFIPNSPGLKIREIRGELSWSSVYHLKPHFNKLQASDAIIQVVRDKQERLFVAGILAGTGADDLDSQNWLFSQNNLELNNATILWKDFSKSKSDVADLRIETLALRSGIRTHELNIGLFSPWHQGKLSLSGKFVHRIGGEPGNWRDWIGDFQWDVQSLDIGQLTRDFEIPFKQLSGVLRSSGALSLSKGLPDGGQFALSIDRPIFQQSKSNQAIEFAQLELDAKQSTSGKFVSLGIQRFTWREKNQGANTAPESLAPMTFSWQVPKKNTEIEKFSFSSSKIGLHNLSLFALNLPLPSGIRQIIEQSEPRGELNDVSISWSENKSTIPLVGNLISGQGPQFDISGKLNNVSVKRYQNIIPGITNLTGKILANQDQGNVDLNSKNLQLVIDGFLADPKMNFDAVKGKINWSLKDKQWLIGLDDLAVANKDIALNAKGSYLIGKDKNPDSMDLAIQFERAEIQTIFRYLPSEMSRDAQSYIEKALVGGQIQNGSLKIKGDPNKAPFDTPNSGELTLTLPITKTVYRPAPLFPANKGSWPEFTDLEGQISMRQAKLAVNIHNARYKGLQIQNLNAEIANIASKQASVQLKAVVNGPIDDMMDYLRTTPVLLQRPTLANQLKISGHGKLDLGFTLPLQNTDDLKLNAALYLNNNTVQWSDLAPFNKVQGTVRLTEDLPRFEQISAEFFGGTVSLKQNVASQNKKDLYDLSGKVDLARLKDHFSDKVGTQSRQLLKALNGNIGFKGSLALSNKVTDLNLDLDLNALGSNLPQPLDKKTGVNLKGQFKYQSVLNESTSKRTSQWTSQLGRNISLEGRINAQGVMSQGIGIGAMPLVPESGIGINLQANDINIDDWHSLLYPKVLSNKTSVQKSTQEITKSSSSPDTDGLTALNARVRNAFALNRQWPNLALNAKLVNGDWLIQAKSPLLEGQVQYMERSGFDLVKGKLVRLNIPESTPQAISVSGNSKAQSVAKTIPLNSIPELDLTIDQLSINQYKPGGIVIKTRNTPNKIAIQNLVITNVEAVTRVSGEWSVDTQGNNERILLDASAEIKDLGEVIAHWGSPKAVEGGKGTVNLKLDWTGPPYDPVFDTLSGKIAIQLENGRLLQVNSGISKVIGVFSLQSLLKFASLDIQGSLGNVVTSGTSFNKLSGDFVIRNGIARTENFTMQLNQARVATSGLVNIPKQTQDLRITIFPTIDASAGALALFAVNPIIGASALIGQYLINNRLNRTLQSDYLVQGSWDKPDVIPLDQNGQPLDPKIIETIRSRNLLREQKMPSTPSTPNTPSRSPSVSPQN